MACSSSCGRNPHRRHSKGRLPRLPARPAAAGPARPRPPASCGPSVCQRPISMPRSENRYSRGFRRRLSEMCTGGIRNPSSAERWRRSERTRFRSCPPCFSSTSGISWNPISRVRSSRRSNSRQVRALRLLGLLLVSRGGLGGRSDCGRGRRPAARPRTIPPTPAETRSWAAPAPGTCARIPGWPGRALPAAPAVAAGSRRPASPPSWPASG